MRLLIASVAILLISISRAAGVPLRETLSPKLQTLGAEARAAGDEYRLPQNVLPESYIISLSNLDFEAATFTGEVTITVSVTEDNVASIKLHSHANTDITKYELLDKDQIAVAISNAPTLTALTQIYEIKPDTALNKGQYTIKLSYNGKIRNDMAGFYRSSYTDASGNQKWLATTQFESTDARSAFPCFDEPGFKATFQIEITRKKELVAISNMKISSTTPVGSDLEKDTFAVTPKMSSYLVAFIVSDFKELIAKDAKNRLYSVWARENAVYQAGYGASISPGIIEFMENFTGVEYEFDRMYEAAIPDFSAGAMENWGLVTYRERLLLYKEDAATTSDKQRIASVIAHEFGHQWFGDLVSPKWWDYLWLNEGFATYFEYFATLAVESEWRLEEQFVVDVHHNALAADAVKTTHPITAEVYSPSEISSIFDSISYDKAGAIIRTMEHFLTIDTFKSGLKLYLEAYAHEAAEPDNLFDKLEEQQKTNSILPAELSAKAILQSWTDQAGYPVITVNKTDTGFTLTQQRFLITGETDDNTVWYVPITYTTQAENEFTDTSPKLWLTNDTDSQTSTSSLGDGWFIFNIQETGFYRVLYENDNYDKLIAYLLTDDYEKIHVLNRAQLIDDALNLARAGMLDYAKALDLTKVLAKDSDYITWAAYFRNLAFLNNRLSGTNLYERLKKYVLELIDSHYKDIGFYVKEKDDHITKLHRVNMISWACRYDHSECKTESDVLFTAWMRSNSSNMIPADIRSTVFCTAINNGEDHHWEHVFDRYKLSDVSTEQVLMLSALGCSKNTEQLNTYLEMTIDANSGIRNQDAVTVFSAVYSRPDGVDVALDFLINHYTDIKTSYTAMGAINSIVTGLASRLTTDAQVTKFTAFLDQQTDLAQVSENVKETMAANLQWFETYQEVFNEWLPEVDVGGAGASQISASLVTFSLIIFVCWIVI